MAEQVRPTTEEIVKALRCTCLPYSEKNREVCDACPFQVEEYLDEYDAELYGSEIIKSCDIDGIGLEAARRLEELSHG